MSFAPPVEYWTHVVLSRGNDRRDMWLTAREAWRTAVVFVPLPEMADVAEQEVIRAGRIRGKLPKCPEWLQAEAIRTYQAIYKRYGIEA